MEEMIDTRPTNCRFRLCDENKPHPRSGCAACGKSVMTGLGQKCEIAPSAQSIPITGATTIIFPAGQDKRIKEIEARLAATTAGTWDIGEDQKEPHDILYSLRVYSLQVGGDPENSDHWTEITWAMCSEDGDQSGNDDEPDLVHARANAAFMANARQDIPFLLELIALQRADNAQLATRKELAEAALAQALDHVIAATLDTVITSAKKMTQPMLIDWLERERETLNIKKGPLQ